MYDLLQYTGKALSIREDAERQIIEVAGLTESLLHSLSQAMELVLRGK